MNCKTGELAILKSLSADEMKDFTRITDKKEARDASGALGDKDRGVFVGPGDNSRLVKWAKKHSLKGKISKKRFRDLKKELKNA